MRPTLEVADIFRRHGEAFRRSHGAHLGRIERRVMAAIELCRTPALGGHVEQCGDCGLVRCAYNSCRNRHCPKCQGLARAEWLEARQAELLPVPYLPRGLHLAGAGGGDRVPEQACGLRHPVPRCGRSDARHRRRARRSVSRCPIICHARMLSISLLVTAPVSAPSVVQDGQTGRGRHRGAGLLGRALPGHPSRVAKISPVAIAVDTVLPVKR